MKGRKPFNPGGVFGRLGDVTPIGRRPYDVHAKFVVELSQNSWRPFNERSAARERGDTRVLMREKRSLKVGVDDGIVESRAT